MVKHTDYNQFESRCFHHKSLSISLLLFKRFIVKYIKNTKEVLNSSAFFCFQKVLFNEIRIGYSTGFEPLKTFCIKRCSDIKLTIIESLILKNVIKTKKNSEKIVKF